MLQVGDTVERYRVEAIAGQGGLCVVYRVRHDALGTLHALKVPLTADPEARRRLAEEARIQARLQHPNVVPVTDTPRVDGAETLLMPFVDGPTLAQVLDRQELPLDDALRLFEGLLDGLLYAHAHGVVHRDLKPANVLLERVEGRWETRITDFGVARELGAERATATRSRAGTPAWMAPEQLRGEVAGPAADVFAAGQLLYELLTGQAPFPTHDPIERHTRICAGRYEPVRALRPEVPPHIEAAVRAALAPEALARPTASDLRRLLVSPSERPAAPAPRPELPTAPRRPLAPLFVAAAAVALSATWPDPQPGDATALLARAGALDGVDPAAALILRLAAHDRGAPPLTPLQLDRAVESGAATAVIPMPGSVTPLAPSPDGRTLAAATDTGELLLLDLQTGAARWRVQTQIHRPTHAAFSPDGTQIAVWPEPILWLGEPSPARTFRATDGALRHSFGHAPATTQVAWSEDGALLFTAGSEGQVTLWDARSGSPRWSGAAHTLKEYGKRLAVFSGGALWLLDGATCVLHREALVTLPPVDAPLPVPCGALGITAVRGGIVGTRAGDVVWLHDPATGETRLPEPDAPLAGDPAARLALAPLPSGGARLWSLAPVRPVADLLGHRHVLHEPALSPAGDVVATPSLDGTLRTWRGYDGALMAELRGHRALVLSATVVDAAPPLLVSASADHTLRLWRGVITPLSAPHIFRGPVRLHQMTTTGDGDLLAVGEDGRVLRWSDTTAVELGVRTLRQFSIAELPGGDLIHADAERHLCRSAPDGALRWRSVELGHELREAPALTGRGILLGGAAAWARLDPETGAPQIGPFAGAVRTIAVSPDRAAFAVAWGDDGPLPNHVELWDDATARRMSAVDLGEKYASRLVWSPDGAFLAIASYAPDVLVVRADGALHARLEGHTLDVTQLAWHPTEPLLVSAGWDRAVIVWELTTGARRWEMQLDAEPSALLWADGHVLHIGTKDGTVWDLDTDHQEVLQVRSGLGSSVRALRRHGDLLDADGRSGVTARWRLDTSAPHPALLTNLRVCPEAPWEVIPVIPFPTTTDPWAPPEACGG
jgi:WD40 repeat protein